MELKPFWRYYGGKWRNAPHYPAPRHPTIIEPFAGAAGYSLRYADRRVVLVEKNPVIAGIWRYLLAATPAEILRLPDIPDGGTVDDMDAPQEARWLAGFWCNNATASPCKSHSVWANRGPNVHNWGGWNARSRGRIASQVDAIRHWTIIEGDYSSSPDVEATWFIDPPYSTPAGSYYPMGSRGVDFAALGGWCRTRRGAVVVCEQSCADWLPFRALGMFRSAPGRDRPTHSAEVIWTHGIEQQGSLFHR